MKNKEERFKKAKELYYKFKEAWKIPYKKAGIKLLMYLVFFIILFLLSFISNKISSKDNSLNNVITNKNSIVEKINKITNRKTNIDYILVNGDTEYRISGNLYREVISGFLETEDGIKKIEIINNEIYEIKNDTKIKIDTNIDFTLINLNYIINIIKEKEPNNLNGNNYEYIDNYNNENITINFYINNNEIEKLELYNNSIKYILNFDIN